METEEKLKSLIDELIDAKKNVLFCLNNSDGLAGMHGLSYWAGVVERIRQELKSLI